MRERDADRFCETACRLLIVDSKRFWIAPRVLRSELTEDNAESTRLIASLALATVLTFTVARLLVSLVTVAARPRSATGPVKLMLSAALTVRVPRLTPTWAAAIPTVPLPVTVRVTAILGPSRTAEN